MVVKAGELRPSQIVSQFGPGCLVDLPEMSMVLVGIDDWNLNTTKRVVEPRLQRALKVNGFRTPPFLKRRDGVGGVPARIFPRFLVCPRCNRLALHTQFKFTERGGRHVCEAAHKGKGKAPAAYPARFIVACSKGHLDDFPWHHWVHPDIPGCTSELRLEDSGKTGSITDLWVRCPQHGRSMSLAAAFGEGKKKRLPACRGNRPWLDDRDPKTCDEELRVILRGASNAYFAVTSSALSIPPYSDPIQTDVALYQDQLAKVDSREKLESALEIMNFPELKAYDAQQIWDALGKLRSGDEDLDPGELRREEYRAFVNAQGAVDYRSQFKVEPERPPDEAAGILEKVMRVLRLREVRALRGFTRIDSVPDIGDMGEVKAIEAGLAPLSKARCDWLPGVELRGEGIFVTLDVASLEEWERRDSISQYAISLERSQRSWFEARAMAQPAPKTPHFVLVHSLAHLLIRRLELEAGYSGSSLRERIYCDQEMAGFLIYTATPDSAGTLGGLVEMARPEDLGPMLQRIWEDTRLCTNDPFCASRKVDDRDSHINGAACHACLLLPETSCEQGNHYLDRALVVRTLGGEGTEFVRD